MLLRITTLNLYIIDIFLSSNELSKLIFDTHKKGWSEALLFIETVNYYYENDTLW